MSITVLAEPKYDVFEILDKLAGDHCSKCNRCYGWFRVGIMSGYGYRLPLLGIWTNDIDKDDKRFGLLKEEYGWDDAKGFLTDTGCRLPRYKRSITCLKFACGALVQSTTEQDKSIIENSLRRLMYHRIKTLSLL